MISTLGKKSVLKKHTQVSFILIIILAMLLPAGKAGAQDVQPEEQIYIVQPGDTLSAIVARFGVTTDDLIAANGIADPYNLVIGTRLTIPGPGTIKPGSGYRTRIFRRNLTQPEPALPPGAS